MSPRSTLASISASIGVDVLIADGSDRCGPGRPGDIAIALLCRAGIDRSAAGVAVAAAGRLHHGVRRLRHPDRRR